MNVKVLNTIPEAARQLSLSPRTIHRRIKDGQLDAVREGRAVRIPGAALLAYAASLPPVRSAAA